MSNPAPRSPSPLRLALLAAAALAALASPGCRGCEDGLVPVGGAFRVVPASLDFGTTVAGVPVTRTLTVTSSSRLDQLLAVEAAPPFSASGPLALPGGTEVVLTVLFDAGATLETGVLHLGPPDGGVDVPLRGEGVQPLACTPSRQCVESYYQLAARACVEVPAPEGAECDPGDRCLERGRCQAGTCRGVARSCDDNNPCTDDACSSELGCVNTPHQCPFPANPCHVATCSVTRGCGEAPAPDLITQCGPVTCSVLNVCVAGTCVTLPTPLHAPCGVQVACLRPGTCEDADGGRACVLPPPGDWLPDWAATVPASPSAEEPVLLASGATLFFEACGPALAPAPDGGPADAGAPDGGAPDAGEVDGGEVDGGGVDAGAGDGGAADAGAADAGPPDAGPPWCALVSYTGTGFLRFAAPFEDGQPRRLVHLAGRGVLLRGPGGLAYHSTADGRPLEGLALAPPVDGVAALPDGGVLALGPDGGLALWAADAGPAWLLATGASVLALDVPGNAYLLSPAAGLLERVRFLPDGGLEVSAVGLDAGPASLTVAGATAVTGGLQAVTFDDAGVPSVLALDPGPGAPVRGGVLQTPAELSVFALRCPVPALACAAAEAALWLGGADLGTGAGAGAIQVAPVDPRSRLVVSALLDLRPPQVAVAAVTVVGFDGGVRAGLQVFGGGERLLVCPFPEASTDLLGGVVTDRALVVLARRPDGGVALESYGLGVAPVHRAGWGAPFGEGGTRRAR